MTEDGWEGVAAAAAVGTAPAARCPPVGIESGFTEGNKKQTLRTTGTHGRMERYAVLCCVS